MDKDKHTLKTLLNGSKLIMFMNHQNKYIVTGLRQRLAVGMNSNAKNRALESSMGNRSRVRGVRQRFALGMNGIAENGP